MGAPFFVLLTAFSQDEHLLVRKAWLMKEWVGSRSWTVERTWMGKVSNAGLQIDVWVGDEKLLFNK